MGLGDRINRLEGHQSPTECPLCHGRGPEDFFSNVVMLLPDEPVPPPCKCGSGRMVIIGSAEAHGYIKRILSGELPTPRKEMTDGTSEE